MQAYVNHGIELVMGLATGLNHHVMAVLEGVSDPVTGFSLHKVNTTIASSSQLGLVRLVGLSMALCKIPVCLATVKGRILQFEGHSPRTRIFIPVWIGSFHPDEQLFGFLEQSPLQSRAS